MSNVTTEFYAYMKRVDITCISKVLNTKHISKHIIARPGSAGLGRRTRPSPAVLPYCNYRDRRLKLLLFGVFLCILCYSPYLCESSCGRIGKINLHHE